MYHSKTDADSQSVVTARKTLDIVNPKDSRTQYVPVMTQTLIRICGNDGYPKVFIK